MQSNAALMQAIETSYKAVRANHEELPPAIFVLSPTSRSGRNTKLGHFFRDSWYDREGLVKFNEATQGEDDVSSALAILEGKKVERYHEILISAEGLDRGGREVMETLLHEAAHALAQARGQKDVTGYQYHNRTFKANAEELGLTVDKMKNRGFAHTTMPEETAESYKLQIELLEGVVRAVRKPTPKMSKANNGQVKMACACGNIVRAGKRVAQSARILCEDCGHHFHPVDRHDLQGASLMREE